MRHEPLALPLVREEARRWTRAVPEVLRLATDLRGAGMSQRYTQPVARERMSHGLCPECGAPAATHSNDLRFWMPRACDLTAQGVSDRIAQYVSDGAA